MTLPPIAPVLAVLGLALTLCACSPLTAFATLTPTDPASRQGQGLAYGAEPRQKLDVYAPAGGAEAAPVAIFFYGGSWTDGRRQDYGWVGRALAAEGFLAINPDYRLYPEVTYPDFLTDGALAVAWAVDNAARYGGDPQRIVLIGHSAGAYNAIMLGLDDSYLRDAGVDPARIRAVAGLAGPYDFLPLEGRTTQAVFGAAGDLAATQPVHQVRSGAPPVFLATGDSDTVVLPRNTEALANALRQNGVTVETEIYPDLGHAGVLLALSRPLRGRAPVLEEMTAFLKAQARNGPEVTVSVAAPKNAEPLPGRGLP
ncbi:alpha/beta hydrolase [Phenylobacterium sp.]|uniref:alpha/beta hydrolase n=1 Tax=Phenylobacterium sp. TaxID=1871053 RepID=UPI002730466A|nr:alpha/beta hydrolase [Phenylobacterium sp.]MDP1618083.1 alpha/beta hydrolase [Phenylobacterium sp.]MDP1986434.1 alpha/beta hydrolase [Phenylobacterium sp.]